MGALKVPYLLKLRHLSTPERTSKTIRLMPHGPLRITAPSGPSPPPPGKRGWPAHEPHCFVCGYVTRHIFNLSVFNVSRPTPHFCSYKWARSQVSLFYFFCLASHATLGEFLLRFKNSFVHPTPAFSLTHKPDPSLIGKFTRQFLTLGLWAGLLQSLRFGLTRFDCVP